MFLASRIYNKTPIRLMGEKGRTGEMTTLCEYYTTKERKYKMDNSCVCCGKIIPDGRQVCPNCDRVPFEELPDDKVYDYDGCKILNTDWEK